MCVGDNIIHDIGGILSSVLENQIGTSWVIVHKLNILQGYQLFSDDA
jgi:hypothetical protein